MPLSFSRYLLVLGLSLFGVLLVAWLYVAAAPMAFMESGYASWAAKATMLAECQLGTVAFFGDSRLEAGLVPDALPAQVSNFGLAAGTPVETTAAIRRAAACPAPPAQAVISLIPEHFGPLSKFFWLLSVRYGFLRPADVLATEQLANQLNDRVSLATPTPDGLRGPVRDWLYALRFPSLSFGSLVRGRVFGRYGSNSARYKALLKQRGWAAYEGGDAAVGADPEEGFAPTPLQSAVFEAGIEALRAHGIEVFLMPMPYARSHPRSAATLAAYRQFLDGVIQRHPGVHMLAEETPVWPDRLFADGAHLDPAGARAFTDRLAACMPGGKLHAGCDLRWQEAGAASGQGSAVLEVQKEGNRQH